MKKGVFLSLLLLSEIMFVTPSFGQTGYKTVPDSMVCITPRQDVFFITSVFTVKEQGASLVLKQKEINVLRNESGFLRDAVQKKDDVISGKDLQLSNCQSDYAELNKKFNKSQRQIKGLKIGGIIGFSLAVTELGIIAFQRAFK